MHKAKKTPPKAITKPKTTLKFIYNAIFDIAAIILISTVIADGIANMNRSMRLNNITKPHCDKTPTGPTNSHHSINRELPDLNLLKVSTPETPKEQNSQPANSPLEPPTVIYDMLEVVDGQSDAIVVDDEFGDTGQSDFGSADQSNFDIKDVDSKPIKTTSQTTSQSSEPNNKPFNDNKSPDIYACNAHPSNYDIDKLRRMRLIDTTPDIDHGLINVKLNDIPRELYGLSFVGLYNITILGVSNIPKNYLSQVTLMMTISNLDGSSNDYAFSNNMIFVEIENAFIPGQSKLVISYQSNYAVPTLIQIRAKFKIQVQTSKLKN